MRRYIKIFSVNEIKAYQLGWSLLGPPLMSVICYTIGDVMVDTAQAHMQKEALQVVDDQKIKRIFLTHHHEDHSGNAAAIKKGFGAQVFGHPITKTKMAAPSKILPYQRYIWGKAEPIVTEVAPEIIETDLGAMVPVHTPGHCVDHTAYYIKSAGVLFSGDLYLGDKIKYFRTDEDMGQQIETLKKIRTIEFDMLLCSHAPKLKAGKKHIESKCNFLEDLYGNIILLWEKGIPAKQIFHILNLKEDHFIKYFCFGDVSMINGVRSAIRHYQSTNKRLIQPEGDQYD